MADNTTRFRPRVMLTGPPKSKKRKRAQVSPAVRDANARRRNVEDSRRLPPTKPVGPKVLSGLNDVATQILKVAPPQQRTAAAARRSVSSGGSSAAPPTTGAPPAAPAPAGTTTSSTDPNQETPEEYVNRLYDPAFRSIARSRAALGQQLTANQASQKRFEEWLAAKRGEGRTWLQDMHNKANEQAASSQAGVSALADQSRAAANATTAASDPQTVASAGGYANAQIAGGNEQLLNTRIAAGTATTNSNLANFDAQALVADALNANSRQQLLAEHNKAMRGYNDDELKLRTQVAASTREEQANRLNQSILQAYKERELGIKEGQLGVAQQNAQTNFMDAQAQAEYRVQTLRLKKLAEERKWTTAQFNSKLQVEKLKIQQRAAARQSKVKDNQAQLKATDALNTAYKQWLPSKDVGGLPAPKPVSELTPDERLALGRQAILFIKARHPRLRVDQVLSIIGGTVGAQVLLGADGRPDQSLKDLLNTFPGGQQQSGYSLPWLGF